MTHQTAVDHSEMPPLILAQESILTAVPFQERVQAAARAGFDGIGLSLTEHQRFRSAGTTDQQMRDILAEAGVQGLAPISVEVMPDDLRVVDEATAASRLATGTRRIWSAASSHPLRSRS